MPTYLSFSQKIAMKVGAIASALVPEIVMPAITGAMRLQSSSVILPAEDAKLKPLLICRKKAGMRMNLNQLGEAILGENEAEHRIQAVIETVIESTDAIAARLPSVAGHIGLIRTPGSGV